MTKAILSLLLLASLSTTSFGRDIDDLSAFWENIDAFAAQSLADWRVTRRALQSREGGYWFDSGAKRITVSLRLKGSTVEAEETMIMGAHLAPRKRPDSKTAFLVGDDARSWRTSDGGGGVIFRRANLIVEVRSPEWEDVERIARRIDEAAVRIGRTQTGLSTANDFDPSARR